MSVEELKAKIRRAFKERSIPMNKYILLTVVLGVVIVLIMSLATAPSIVAAQTSCPPVGCTAGRDVGRDYFVQVVGRLNNVPMSDFAVDALVAWKPYENTSACWNPLATTWKMDVVCYFNCLRRDAAGKCIMGVQHYQNQDMGVRATANTLNQGYYDAIRRMLRQEAFDREGLRAALGTWGTCSGSGCDPLLNRWQELWNARRSGPAGYTFCANENQRCNFSGTKDVAYGANGRFNYRYGVTGGIDCNNGTFGDPIPGVVKACYIKDSSSSSGPAGYTFCANENQRCNFSGTKDVAYGANGRFNYRYGVTGGIDCNNGTFGDPFPGVVKACYIKDSSSSGGPAGYTFCSRENQRCSFSGTKDVAYGANGRFNYRYGVTGGIDCNNGTFGDPFPGVVKACYIK
jgi:spore coat protein U-like protein